MDMTFSRDYDLIIGFIVALVVGVVCFYSKMEILGLGAFSAAGLYMSKLVTRHRERRDSKTGPE